MKKQKCCSQGVKLIDKKRADNRSQLLRINRIKGQTEGIYRMVQSEAYCPEIIIQIQAVRSALASLQAIILSNHLKHCIHEGLKKGDQQEIEKLFEEIVGIFKKN